MFSWNWNKPIGRVIVNTEHPFASGLIMCVPFIDNSWDTTDTATKYRPYTIWGTAAPRNNANAAGTVNLASNLEGNCISCPSGTDRIGNWTDFIPTTGVTVAVIRRKLTADLPGGTGGSLFGDELTIGTQTIRAMCPAFTGSLLWDFGGTSGANRISIASFPLTTTIDRFVFTAGRNGMNVWQNGKKIGSSSTAVTRTASGGFYLNGGSNAGDDQEFNFLWVVNYPWSDELCAWWSSEPYAALVPTMTERLNGIRGQGSTGKGGKGKGKGNPGNNIVESGGANVVNIGNFGLGWN